VSLHVPAALLGQVRARAADRCAYCQSAEALLGVTFEIDHIVPQSAGGETSIDNLCLSCPTCNRHKAARKTALDPVSGESTPLYHPLLQSWNDHFVWSNDGAIVIGLTAIARATVSLLHMNRPVLVQMRRWRARRACIVSP
jgi:hypothetical protein